MANHYFQNQNDFNVSVSTNTGNNITVQPGESVYGDDAGEFSRAVTAGTLVDTVTLASGSTLVYTETVNTWGVSGFSGFSGYSGFSGISGFSGYSGTSGYSGPSGYSGFSGYSGGGVTSVEGATGAVTFSGYSGYSFAQSGSVVWLIVP